MAEKPAVDIEQVYQEMLFYYRMQEAEKEMNVTVPLRRVNSLSGIGDVTPRLRSSGLPVRRPSGSFTQLRDVFANK